jgi:hypothetical protein
VYSFYEAGLGQIGSWAYGNGSEGLPVGGRFISVLDGSTVFQLESYDRSNVLFMDQFTLAGTLTLTTPAVYKELAILANSSAGGGTGLVTIHFTDGSSAGPFSYAAPDWFYNTGFAPLTHFGRVYGGNYGAFFTEDSPDNNPSLYQSTIALPSPYNARQIASLSFARPTGSNVKADTMTGIFAVSGKN